MKYSIIFLITLVTSFSFAQQKEIRGTVTSKSDGVPIPGVSVIVAGTTSGTVTDFDGNYNLAANTGDVLQFSFVGMLNTEITVGTNAVINVQLEEDISQLDEVVVTALGVSRVSKKLGYLVEEVGSETLSKASEPDLANALRGKLTGVEIQAGATGPGSSANITIRGITSLSGNNQPLIVIDGVIVSNTNVSQGDFAGGFDFGNGLSNLNPNDVEKVSVLKAGNATALYGYLGASGAILITTKSGKTKDVKVNLSSSVSMENLLVSPNLQNQYGQGKFNTTNNTLEYSVLEGGSWGPALDGTQRDRFDGNSKAAYSANQDDFKNFYDTGVIANNSVTISQAKEDFKYKFSYAHLDNKSIQKGTKLEKHNFGLKASLQVNSKIKVLGKIDYINQKISLDSY